MAQASYSTSVSAQSSAVVFTDEATSTIDNISYQITNAAKRIWDYATALVVEDGGSPTVESYTVNGLNGTVTFESADAGRVITVTGAYVVLTTLATAKDFALTSDLTLADTTPLGQQFSVFTPTTLTGSITLGRYDLADSTFADMLLAGDVKVINYTSESSEPEWLAYAIANSDAYSTAIGGVGEESISFNITRKMILE